MPEWLAGHAPLGIVREIPTSGVLPATEPYNMDAERDRLEFVDHLAHGGDAHLNYSSYNENREDAEQVKHTAAEAGDAFVHLCDLRGGLRWDV